MALLALLGALIFPRASKQEYRVADVTKPETITLTKESGQGNIHSFSITGSGQIDGNATITIFLNGKPYKIEQLSDRVHFHWGGDWYSDSAEIKYEPLSVKVGSLVLKYRFSDTSK